MQKTVQLGESWTHVKAGDRASHAGTGDAVFDTFITKPVEPSNLVDAIARVLMR